MATDQKRPPAIKLSEEAPVFDSKGEKLGTVKQLGEEHFKIDVHMGRDYWLPYTLVESDRGGEVHLTCAGDDLEQYKTDAGAEDLGPAQVEESLAHTNNPLPMERRYDAEAEYLTHPRPLT